MQAEAGLMTLTGEPDGPPPRFGSSMIDFMTGMTGVVGPARLPAARAARPARAATSTPALFDVALHQLSYPGTWYINGGDDALAAGAQRAPVDRAGADRAHHGRLDLRHVHEGEVLGGAGARRSAARS